MARQRRTLLLTKPRVKIAGCGSPIIFIDSIADNPGIVEETLFNIKINTGGNIATIFADYVLLNEGKRANWGQQTWQLVTGFCAVAIFNYRIN